MTKRQKEVFDFIKDYWATKGYSPSYDDIAIHMGYSSRSNVHRIVHSLVERKFIEHHPGKSRSLMVLTNVAFGSRVDV